ncbi:MAG: hypothetical protein R2744_08830 [Bacteroidales bacterium]
MKVLNMVAHNIFIARIGDNPKLAVEGHLEHQFHYPVIGEVRLILLGCYCILQPATAQRLENHREDIPVETGSRVDICSGSPPDLVDFRAYSIVCTLVYPDPG